GRADEAEAKDAHADHHTPSAFLDSSRSSAQRRLVSAPKAGSATSALSRSRGQPVTTTSISRPGRADITATRSDSSAASSSACVISITVAAVSRHSRKQLLAHEQARLLIERAERFIEQNEAWLEHQRARDADALAHAAR